MADGDEDYVYDETTGEWRPASDQAQGEVPEQGRVRDAVGTPSADGDSVTLI